MLSDEGTMIVSVPAFAEITRASLSYGHSQEIMVLCLSFPSWGRAPRSRRETEEFPPPTLPCVLSNEAHVAAS